MKKIEEIAKQGKTHRIKSLLLHSVFSTQNFKFTPIYSRCRLKKGHHCKLVADGMPQTVKLFTKNMNLRADFQMEDSYQVLCPSGHLTTSNGNIYKSYILKVQLSNLRLSLLKFTPTVFTSE